jgi:hypothetical protein
MSRDAARGLAAHKIGISRIYLWALNFGMDLRPSRGEGTCHGADTRSHQMPTVRFTDEPRIGSRRQGIPLTAVPAMRGA